jgi:hypothetical protein
MVLAGAEGELGLQEQALPGQQSLRQCRGDGPADGGLVVVPALVGGVDAAEDRPFWKRASPSYQRLTLLAGCEDN